MATLDLTGREFHRDPAKAVASLREQGPLVSTCLPIIGSVWMTTTQEMAGRVLKDSATFSIRKEGGGLAGLRWWMPGIFQSLAQNMLTMDEPDHTRLRAIVDEAFRRRVILDLEPDIRATADEMAAQLFDKGTPADLVARYARQLPLAVICELLGLPFADRHRFMAHAQRATMVDGLFGFVRMVPALYRIRRYLRQEIDRIRRDGGHGLIAELVQAERDGADITSDEIVAMVFLLLFAGHETTTHLISGAAFELARSPELRDWLREDPNRLGLAVEEFLRFVSPVQFTKPRFARRDIELDGITIRKGDKVMAMLSAANLDPDANDAPEKLDLARRPNRHVAFGTGIHFCLGHQLARLEGICALAALLDRWPSLSLAVDPAHIRWRERPGLRAIEALPVKA